MRLTVLQSDSPASPWYSDGLKFTCTQCGNCCSGPSGSVWITTEEIRLLAAHLHITPEETVERYCRKIAGQFSLRETRSSDGSYDCIFLKSEPAQPVDAKNPIPVARKICSIYAVRPLQCRVWPFWDANLISPEAWSASAKRCHGMNRGRSFSRGQIEELRDAKEWPKNPPTSKRRG